MNFLENVFEQLERSAGRRVLQEIRGEQIASVTGAELLAHYEVKPPKGEIVLLISNL